MAEKDTIKCTICEEVLCGEDEWNEHLTLNGHQIRTRGRVLTDTDLDNMRECSLVVFLTFDLSVEGAGKIINYFWGGRTRQRPYDFVWWEDRPRIGIISLKNRRRVERILGGLEGGGDGEKGRVVEIDGVQGAVHVEGAFELGDLQWRALLPQGRPEPVVEEALSELDWFGGWDGWGGWGGENMETRRVKKVRRRLGGICEKLFGKGPRRKFRRCGGRGHRCIITLGDGGDGGKGRRVVGRGATWQDAEEEAGKMAIEILRREEEDGGGNGGDGGEVEGGRRTSGRKTRAALEREREEILVKKIENWEQDGLKVENISEEKGRGVVATKRFLREEFVVEYVGELLTSLKAKEREGKYAEQMTGCYMYYFKYNNKRFCVDATRESDRLGRLINHSKMNGNLVPKVKEVPRGNPRIIFLAGRDIEIGEELCYDYGDRDRNTLKEYGWLKK